MTQLGAWPVLDRGVALDVLLRDGTIAQVRLLVAGDRPALVALAAAEEYVDELVRCAEAGEALVGLLGNEVVAVASFARQERDPSLAEFAMVIDDRHQAQGLGALLLEHLALLARHRGVHVLTAAVPQDNTRMLELLADSGFALTSTSDHGLVQLEIDLTEAPSLWAAVLRRDAEAECASLEKVLRPRSVAVIGSRHEGSVASEVLNSLERSGFTGTVSRLDRHTRLQELAAVPDLAVVAVPAEAVLGVARDAAAVGVHGLLVLSAGFAEAGAAGKERQQELVRICRDANVRLLGPNCLGLVNTDPAIALNATFCDAQPRPGSLALVSQSGAVGIAALRHAEQRGTGLSVFVSTGNKADVSGNDLLCFLQQDDRTAVIGLYLESFGNARKFARLARTVGRTKPVVVVKAGRSAAGAKAGASHTAAAATPDVAVEALLRDAGVLRANDLDEMFDIVSVLASGRLPAGPRVAVIGNSGGPGVLAADACDGAGLVVAELSEQTQVRLSALLPAGASVGNPVDLMATVAAEEFEQAVRLVMNDPGVDAVVAIYTPLMRGAEDAYAQALVAAQSDLPEVPVLASLPGLTWAPGALEHPPTLVPFFEFPERAVRALGRAVAYAAGRDRTTAPSRTAVPAGALTTAQSLIDRTPNRGASEFWLPPRTATDLLAGYGIPCAPLVEVRTAQEATDAAEGLGYPIALKATGPTIVHKADVGGVVLDLESGEQVRQAFLDLEDRVGPSMTGAVVQRMSSTRGRLELIAGLTVDASVGPLLLVGAGGTLTDLLADRVVRVPPRNRHEAVEQLMQLRCAQRFAGFRNLPPLDLEATADVLVALGVLARELPEVRELDINPLLVGRAGVTGLDVRIRIGPPDPARDEAVRTLTR